MEGTIQCISGGYNTVEGTGYRWRVKGTSGGYSALVEGTGHEWRVQYSALVEGTIRWRVQGTSGGQRALVEGKGH